MKKIFNKKSSIIAIIIFCGFLLPQIANAGTFSTIGKDIFLTLSNIVFSFLNWLFKASASFFEGILSIGFKDTLDNVKFGWQAVRDFANMFFILFLVIIAFATILRIEKYGIRTLLPKVILIALLINFSLVICSVIIDFSNITASFFIDDINQRIEKTKQAGLSQGITISSIFADSLNMVGLYKVYTDCEQFRKDAIEACNKEGVGIAKFFDISGLSMFKSISDKATCIDVNEKLYNECITYGSVTVKNEEADDTSFLSIFISSTVGSIVLIIASFSLFAGGLMLLARIIFIWILVTIVPLVFICYILPGLRKNWQNWWNTFLKWCFFAPFYAFFVWMAVYISANKINQNIARITQNTVSGTWNPADNVFVTNPGEQLIGYFIIIGFLLGGLIAAQKMGIYGADTAVKVGKSWYKGAVGKISRKPAELASRSAGSTVKKAGEKIKSIPGLGRIGRSIESQGKMIRQKPLSTKEAENYEKRFALMSPEDQIKEIASQKRGAYAVLGSKIALENGTLAKTKNNDAVLKSMAQFKAYSFNKQAEELEKQRPDVITNNRRQYEVIKEMRDRGELNKLSSTALINERVVNRLTMLGVDLEKLRDASKEHSTNLQAALKTITDPTNQARMIKMGINPIAKEIQHAYAAQTGDITRMDKARQMFFARDIGPEGLKRIKSITPEMINVLPAKQVKVIIDKMQNKDVAKEIIKGIKANPSHSAHGIVINDKYLNNLA